MWLLSKWESLGNIIDYLATNDVDQAQRLDLVRTTEAIGAYTHLLAIGTRYSKGARISPFSETCRLPW